MLAESIGNQLSPDAFAVAQKTQLVEKLMHQDSRTLFVLMWNAIEESKTLEKGSKFCVVFSLYLRGDRLLWTIPPDGQRLNRHESRVFDSNSPRTITISRFSRGTYRKSGFNGY